MPKQFPEVELPRKRSTIWCMLILDELEKAFSLVETGVHLLTPAQRLIFSSMRDDAVLAAHDLLLAEGNCEEISRRWPETKLSGDARLDLQNATEFCRGNEADPGNENRKVSVDEFIQQITATERTEALNPLDNHLGNICALVEAGCSWLEISRFLRLHGIDTHPSAIANYYNRMRRQSA